MHRQALIALLFGAATSEAQAQDCPQAFVEFEVRSMVRSSTEAISRDDALGHKRLWSEFLSSVPCLDAQLPRDSWAELLVNEAIVRHATGAPNWQGPLSVALKIYPEMSSIPEFLLDEWSPPPPSPSSGIEIPDDAALFADGILVSAIPRFEGEHIVQMWRDGRWHSALVIDTTPPASWLASKDVEVVEVEAVAVEWVPHGTGSVGFVFGFSLANQFVEDPGTFLADGRQYAGLSGLATQGIQPIASVGGIFWDAVVPVAAPAIRTDALSGGFALDTSGSLLPVLHVGPAAILDGFHIGLGGGVFRVYKVEGNVPIGVWLPQPHLVLGARTPRTDFEVGGGVTSSAAHAVTRGGWLLSPPRALTWRLGFDAHLGTVWFSEAPPGDRRAAVLQVGLLGRFDATWGRAGKGGAL